MIITEWSHHPLVSHIMACEGCGRLECEGPVCCPERSLIPVAKLLRILWSVAYPLRAYMGQTHAECDCDTPDLCVTKCRALTHSANPKDRP